MERDERGRGLGVERREERVDKYVGGSKVLMGRIEALQRLIETFWFWRIPRRLSMPSNHLAKPSLLVVVAFWLERSPLFWSAMPYEEVFAQVSISGHLKTELLLFLGSSLRRSGLKGLEGASVFGSIGSSTVEMDPSLAVVTPDVESIPRNAEIPSSPGSLLVPTYSLIFEEPSPDAPSNSAVPPVVLDTVCGSSSLIPSEGLQGSPTVASDVVCTDGIAKRSELVSSCPLVPECSKGTFGLPKKSSFIGLLGKRKLSEVSGPSQDITSSSGTALPSINVAVPPSQSSNPDASSLGSLELDVETMLSSINDDIQASGALESAARKVRFPKVELGLSNLSGDVLFRSLVAHQVKSIILTRACAREFQDSSGDLLLALVARSPPSPAMPGEGVE
ncbi:hypothetical protein EJB05_40641, partial [Eragrostis curvula]